MRRAGLEFASYNFYSESVRDKEWARLQNVLEEVSADTTNVQALLWLLGENKSCELFKKYDDAIWGSTEDDEFNQSREPLRKKRKDFFDELSRAYRKA